MRKFRVLTSFSIIIACLVAISMLLPSSLKAQSFYGAIAGTVTDASGAAVSTATVTMINVGTNEKRSAQSDASGNYRFVNLVPATYKVEASAAGYKRFSRSQVPVQVDSTIRVDVTLEVGAVSETVEVTTQAPLLQTDSGSLGGQVEGKQVEQMPLNGRNAMNLIALVPGVTPGGASQGSSEGNQGTHTSNQGWGNYQIGGGLGNQGSMYVDGSPMNTLGGNFVGFVPTQDAIQEFKVATNSVSAEFGRFAGGVVEMTTRSGANAWHGTTYEYLRNSVFNANNYFTKQEGAPREKWNQNQYGASFSGPIKKDKAFFIFTWEGFASRLGSLAQVYVPSSDMQKGIFDNAHLTDPTGHCAIQYNATTNTSTIPNSCLDSSAAIMKNYYPAPNHADTGAYNYSSSTVTGSNSNQYNGRADYAVSDRQRIFARYSYLKINDLGSNPFHNANGFMTAGSHGDDSAIQAVVGDTYTINPTTILDLRASFLRVYNDNMPDALGVDQAKFGYGNLSNGMSYKVNPDPSLSGKYGLYSFRSMDVLSFNWANSYAVSANVTKIAGNHTLKAGADIRLMDNSGTATLSNTSGQYDFNNTMYTGDEWANFLLGYANDGAATTATMTAAYNYYQGYYLTDTWQVARKLTLNLGLRWELPGAIAERKDRAVIALPNVNDPLTGVKGTLAMVNTTAAKSRYLENPKHNLFSPRLGFAYRYTENTVLRGGFGLSYPAPDLQTTMLPVNAPINSASTSWNNDANATYRLSNPFPSGLIQSKGRADTAFMKSELEQAINGPVPTTKYPYSEQWNLTVSHQMKGDLMVEVGYAGSQGIHLPEYGWNINELSSQYYSQGAALFNSASLPTSIGTQAITVGQSLRPFPAYHGFTDTAAYIGTSNYQAMMVRGEKRFGAAGVIGAAYTWAKMLGTADTVNPFLEGQYGVGAIQDYNNLKGERSLSSSDIPHRLVINYMINLPFGQGQRYGANLNGIAKRAISGWALNGITMFQSGQPFALSMNGNNLTQNFGGGTLRPNVAANCSKSISGSATSRLNKWFNTACFTSPGAFAFGNESRVDSSLKGQGTDNWDMAAQKSTKITDKTALEFRFELFNLFNRTLFGLPGLGADGRGFGQVTSAGNPRLGQASLRLNF